ncbi:MULTISPECIES: SixA phosphatase family protein [Winogradskyella]|uniref:SixA phosphatase family protein n=1 Tax=Winogradskyella TaxID=286104 RepID=UPI0015CDC563|nr:MULTISPECIES: phosphoglycerate mutase family protein [Winogradskyella]QXP78977.1 histidine phosphatase family protein [Winogradskyella sp. HaHa_3_26]
MKHLILITFFSFFIFASCKEKSEKQSDEISTYYLIRHAEKDRSDNTSRNPNLTNEGLKRADNWAKHFKDIDFDAIYSTDYNRTKQTAMPTVKSKNIELQIYDPSDLKIEAFLEKTKGKTVLIVGHSNTTPKFVNELLGEEKYDDIADDNNANLYLVTLTKDIKRSKVSVVN